MNQACKSIAGEEAVDQICYLTGDSALNGEPALQGGLKSALDFGNTLLVPLIEGPLLDSFRSQQSRLSQDSKVLAGRRLGDAKLLGNKYAAYPVADQVAVDLGRKVRPWVLEPAQYLQAPLIGKRLDYIQRHHKS